MTQAIALPRKIASRARAAVAVVPRRIKSSLSAGAWAHYEKRLNSSRAGRKFLQRCSVVRHPWEFVVRRSAAHRLGAVPDRVTIDLASGYARFGPSDFAELPGLLQLARDVYEDKRPRLGVPNPTAKKKEYLSEILNDADLRRYPEFVEFCLSPDVVRAVSRYLGTVPVLRRVGLQLSTPADVNADSRLYHLDPEDFRQVKIFINVFDVTPSEGPFTFLPGHVSDAVLDGIARSERAAGIRRDQFRRWNDEELEPYARPSDRVELLGPAGTGAFVDTSRCMHFGSRIAPGSMRLVFYVQYMRYHFAYATDQNVIQPPGGATDVRLAQLLTARRPGRTPYT